MPASMEWRCSTQETRSAGNRLVTQWMWIQPFDDDTTRFLQRQKGSSTRFLRTEVASAMACGQERTGS
jgi:hypothetical protein